MINIINLKNRIECSLYYIVIFNFNNINMNDKRIICDSCSKEVSKTTTINSGQSLCENCNNEVATICLANKPPYTIKNTDQIKKDSNGHIWILHKSEAPENAIPMHENPCENTNSLLKCLKQLLDNVF